MAEDEIKVLVMVLAAFALLVGYFFVRQDSQKKKLKARIRAGFGQPPSREYRPEEIKKIGRYFERSRKSGVVIDDITWNDLELEDVFIQLNHTYSSIGEEMLYKLLRTPVTDEEELLERERLISWFQREENGQVRERLQELFARMGRTRRVAVCDYIYELAELPGEPVWKDYLSAAALLLVLAGMLVSPSGFVLPLIAVLSYNIFTYYSRKAKVENYFVCIGYLLTAERYGKELCRVEAGALELYQDKIRRASAGFAPVRKNARWIRAGADGNAGDIAALVLDYINMMFHADLIAFQHILKQVKKMQDSMMELIETLGFVESMIAIASYRESLYYYAVPRLSHEKPMHIKALELYHPLISSPVANSISEERPVLLTGSNASGKSTFLKTVAINGILAQSIHTVLGKSYDSNYFQIFTSMALRDNLESKESYYIVEIKSLKRILDRADDELPTLCFVDEVLRGTNTVERIAASSQILKSLAERNVFCFAATHDIELTRLLEDQYANYHFDEEVEGEEVRFPYLLQKGRATSRNAIRLLKMLGYEDRIIEAAFWSANYFTEEGIWKLT